MKYTKIKSDKQYNEYCELHEKLTYDDYNAHLEEIELLEILIDEYEQRTIESPNGMNPVEIISYLLQENNITKSQLAKQLNVSRQLITDILNYRRNISKTMVNKLSNRFKLNPAAFSRPYEVKSSKARNIKEPI
jgi:HTH-type transcriptional regulator/antitoxin HigA